MGLLFSGGLDSAILLGLLLRRVGEVQPFYVRTGACWQEAELEYARQFCQRVASDDPHGARLNRLVVLNLPTIGPVLLDSLASQDQFLAGFILLFVAVLTVVGMLLSDLLLAVLDPRIRLGAEASK